MQIKDVRYTLKRKTVNLLLYLKLHWLHRTRLNISTLEPTVPMADSERRGCPLL